MVQTPFSGVATNTALSSSNPASLYGQPVTFTATITANGSPVTVGTVTFLDGSSVLASGVPLNSNGQAACTTATLSVFGSPYVITADYSGATGVLASSNTTKQTIVPVNLNFTVTDNSDGPPIPILCVTPSRKSMPTAAYNTITIDPTLTGGQTITLTSLLPVITANVAINGPGASVVSVSGNNLYQVFEIGTGTTVAISGLTITHGQEQYGVGGGLLNDGLLTISGCTIEDSLADYAGGIYNDIYGSLTILNSTIADNSTIYGGIAGGIDNQGSMTLTDSADYWGTRPRKGMSAVSTAAQA